MTDLQQLVWERFVHREDAYAKQEYDHNAGTFRFFRQKIGQCQNVPQCGKLFCQHMADAPLTEKLLDLHLQGKITLGLYPVRPDDQTLRWLCFDIDGKEVDAAVGQQYTIHLAKLITKIAGKGTFLVEQSGSKGYHIWIFFGESVPAQKAYTLVKWIISHKEPPKGITVETFPKQPNIVRYGNLVKLPLGIHRKTNTRCLFVDGTFTPFEDQHGALESVKLWREKTLDYLLDRYDISLAPIRSTVDTESKGSFPCMKRVMEEGLEEGRRDIGLHHLSLYLKDKGLPMWATEAVMHGVTTSPPVTDMFVQSKVENAYNNSYSVFPCWEPQIDHYCSSACAFWNQKVDRRAPDRKPEDVVGRLSRD